MLFLYGYDINEAWVFMMTAIKKIMIKTCVESNHMKSFEKPFDLFLHVPVFNGFAFVVKFFPFAQTYFNFH